MITIAIANHKGGVGKTALSLNLAYGLAELEWRVLLVDADPQASLTEAIMGSAEDENMAHVMGDAQAGTMAMSEIIRVLTPYLHLAPSDIELANSQLGMFMRPNREYILRRMLDPIGDDYDVCLIDCAPALSLPTINALAAADGVLIPTKPAAVDLRGTRLFLQTINQLKSEINPDLQIIGIVPTHYNKRTNFHQSALADLELSGVTVYPAIGHTVKIQESMTNGKPLSEYDPRNPQNEAHKEISQRIDEWLRRKQNR